MNAFDQLGKVGSLSSLVCSTLIISPHRTQT